MQKSEAMAFKKIPGAPPNGAAPKAGAKSGQKLPRRTLIPPPAPVDTSNQYVALAANAPAAKKRKKNRPRPSDADASKVAAPAPVGNQSTIIGSVATASATGASAEDQHVRTVDPKTLASNAARAEVDACKEEERG